MPRNTRYEVPQWRVKSIKDRKAKILFGPYDCPNCQQDKLKIRIDEKIEEAYATCDCGFRYVFKYVKSYEPVDYYNKLLDESRR